MKAIRLRCEQMENPLGIDVQKPCLSWICQDGIHQTAYEIEAKTGEDVIYNSGKVASDSMNVMLDADLASKQQVVWHVRLWDEKDVCGEWSQDAHFEMGIIKADQFVAKWINPEGQINTDEMQPVSYLRKTFIFDGNAKDARAYVSAHGIYEVRINGKRVGDFVLAPGTSSYDKQMPYQTYDVTDFWETEKIPLKQKWQMAGIAVIPALTETEIFSVPSLPFSSSWKMPDRSSVFRMRHGKFPRQDHFVRQICRWVRSMMQIRKTLRIGMA